MPAFYAHSRFGRKVAERLKGDLREIIKENYTQFEIGLQGPDIFFFYRAYSGNPVSKYGNHLHSVSALPFFRHAVKVVRQKGRRSKEYAYLLGFICHYILDSESHPYVDEMIQKTGVQHMEIEEEFEKRLLRMDGKNPLGYPVARLVPTDRRTVEAISPFYPSMRPKLIRNSLRWLKFIKKLFTAPQRWKQELLNRLLKAAGMYDEFKGVMNQRTDNDKCRISNEGLLLRFETAVELAPSLLESFDRSIRTGQRLNERFNRTFE